MSDSSRNDRCRQPSTPLPEVAFGLRLRRAREVRGLSLRELARRLSRSHSNLWDYERGHRLATSEIVRDYERELGLRAGELQGPLEEARIQVYGPDRDRRRPFRDPALNVRTVPHTAGWPPDDRSNPPGTSSARRNRIRTLEHAFVGRESEVAAAQAWLGEARAGDPRIVVFKGDAGIGKSTLLDHVLAEAQDDRWTIGRASCLQGASIGYLPLVTALTTLSVTPGRDGGPLDPSEVIDLFSLEPTGRDGDDSGLGADRRRLHLFLRTATAILAAADHQPLILALDDIQWADESTLSLLEHLVVVVTQQSALTPVPLVVLMTTRPLRGNEPARRTLDRIEREVTHRDLRLTALGDLAINELVTDLAKTRPSPRLIRALSVASQGNPLLLESLFDRLVSVNAVSVRGGVLTTTDDDFPVVPLDLEAELGARLQRVSGEADQLLTWAALLGDGNRLGALQPVSQLDDGPFDRAMVLLSENRLLYEDGDFYRFDHPQLREVVYGRIPARRRAGLHLHIADRLEQYHGSEALVHAAVVAHHLQLAGSLAAAPRTARYARTAADQSFAIAAWADAARQYDATLAATAPAERTTDLLWRAGLAHFRNHDHPTAELHLSESVRTARHVGDIRAWGRSALLLTKARVTGASKLGVEPDVTPVIEFLETAGDDVVDLKARAHSLLADARFAQFDFDAGVVSARKALENASRTSDDEVHCEVTLALGIQHLARLELDDAEARLGDCQQSAARLGDQWDAAWSAVRLPLVYWARGDLDHADTQALDAVALASNHFDWAESSLALACRVAVATAQGRVIEAKRLATLSHQQYLRSLYPWTILVVAPALAAINSYQGDLDGALEAIAWLDSAGVDGQLFAMAAKAVTGNGDDLREPLVTEPLHFTSPPAFTLFDLASAALQIEVGAATGDRRMAAASLPVLEAAYTAGFAFVIGWPMSVPRLLGVANRCLGRPKKAEVWLRIAIAAAERAPAAAEGARARLDLAETLVNLAAWDAAQTEIDVATKIFAELGLGALHSAAQKLNATVSVQSRP
jgi:transcriptional regulator with XRE-family HTH domain